MTVDVDAGPTAALKALADPVRWRIVQALAGEELCVCHLTEDLGIAQPLVSHHLRVLRDAELVTCERWRYWTYYRLDQRTLAALGAALDGLAATPTSPRRPCC